MRKFINAAIMLSILLLGTQMLWAGGNIEGRINYSGRSPSPRVIRMGSDPVCAMAHDEPVISDAIVINENSTVRHVLVSIQSGLEGQTFPTPEEPVILTQSGCMYAPHVWGAMVGQTVEIRNEDETIHNIHSMSKVNRSFNISMPKIIKKKNQVFDKVEDVFAIKCDVHPWMQTWVQIFDHPFFAVSDDKGDFAIGDVPPGTYTVRAWHENSRLPAQTQTVTVVDGETLTLDFAFQGPQ